MFTAQAASNTIMVSESMASFIRFLAGLVISNPLKELLLQSAQIERNPYEKNSSVHPH
jgi:hypothetical protein